MPAFAHAHAHPVPSAPDGGWVPSDTSGNVLWLPATLTGLWQDSGATTPVAANGEPVGYRSELSPTGLYVVQATAGQRPTWAQNGFATDKPAISFDGADDSLARAATCGNIRTLGLSYKLRATSGAGVYQCICHLSQSDGATLIVHICNAGGYKTLSISNNSVAVLGVGVAGICNDLDSHSLVITYNGGTRTDPASWGVRLDGVAQTVAASGAHGLVAGTSSIGRYPAGVFPASLDLGVALAYDSVLAEADIANLEAYLDGVRA